MPDATDREVARCERLSKGKVTIHNEQSFPYLDMELYWHKEDELKCRVHLKPGQQLKYLNKSSTHRNHTFRAITSSVTKRLAQLTSLTEENKDESINKLYPGHAHALESANLAPKKYPTLSEALEEARIQSEIKMELKVKPGDSPEVIKRKERAIAKSKRDKKRTTWFCIGFSNIWDEPLQDMIKNLKEEYKLTWLRVSMSYHKFPNVKELFNGDLQNKLMADIVDTDVEDLDCNCNKNSKTRDGKCIYDEKCRLQTVVYEAYFPQHNKSYIGKTQRHVKTRMQEHFADAWQVVKHGRMKCGNDYDWYGSGGYKKADAFAKFAGNMSRDCKTKHEVKERLKSSITVRILYKGDRLRCAKSQKTIGCKLCMRERREILHRMRKEPQSIINDRSEIYGACKCNTRFHKLCCIDQTLRTRKAQKKSASSQSTRPKRPTPPKRSESKSSCNCCNTQSQSTLDSLPPSPIPSQYCIPTDDPKTNIEKLPPKDEDSIACFIFDTISPVTRPIQLDWEKHTDTIMVPYPSRWQYLENNPCKLHWVGAPKIQTGQIDTNIPGLPEQKPTPNPSNLEIDQIISASKCYPQIAETLALTNLIHPEQVDDVIWKNETVMV